MPRYYDEQRETTTTRPHRQGVHFPCKPSRESFPPNPSKELLARHGFFPAKDAKPEYDPDTERVVPVGWDREENQYGTWYIRRYEIQPLPESEVAATVREKRNALLTESDSRALPDYPHGEGERVQWLTYRQALRDVTRQEGFPYVVEWPDKPGSGHYFGHERGQKDTKKRQEEKKEWRGKARG
jgi:hypothetical protein